MEDNQSSDIGRPLQSGEGTSRDIKGQTMTMTMERILANFFKEYPNEELKDE